MTQQTEPEAPAARQGKRAFASPGMIRTLAGTVMAVGVMAGVWGVAYDGPFSLTIPGIPADTSTSAGSWLEGHADTVTLHSWGSTVPEQLLNRGGFTVVGLCMGVGAVWLRRVLISIAEGRPFQSGNAARIAGIGGLVVLASLANDILPVLGSRLVLQRLGLTGASSPIFADLVPSLGLLLAVPFLLALAEAFRRGAELAGDVEGLV